MCYAIYAFLGPNQGGGGTRGGVRREKEKEQSEGKGRKQRLGASTRSSVLLPSSILFSSLTLSTTKRRRAKRTSLELVSHKLRLESLLERFAIFSTPLAHPFTPPSTGERGTLLCPYFSVSARTPLVHRLLSSWPPFLFSLSLSLSLFP